MYCPRCGGRKFAQLYGGNCSKACLYCDKAIYCRDVFAGKICKDSVPVINPFKAIMLRVMYNKNSDNKERGKKNIKEHEVFYKKTKEHTRLLRRLLEKAQGALDGQRAIKITIYKVATEELGEQMKKK